MAYSITWYLEPYIIYMQYEGDITVDEFAESGKAVTDFQGSITHTTYILVDLSRIGKIPLDIPGLSKAFDGTRHPNQTILVYGHNRVMDVIGKSIAKMAHLRAHFVKDEEAALKRIAAIDPNIHRLP